jgi:hypothetical protein
MQNPIIINDGSGYNVRTAINSALSSMVTMFAGMSAPSPLYPYQLWINNSTNQLMQANMTATGSDAIMNLNSDGTFNFAEISLSQSANKVLASPNGSAGNPSFRTLVVADISDISSTYLSVSGNAATATYATTAGSAPANGGTSAACSGNAATATKLATGRTIALTGDVTGTSGAFDGSGNLSFATTLATVPINKGGTGATTAATALAALGGAPVASPIFTTGLQVTSTSTWQTPITLINDTGATCGINMGGSANNVVGAGGLGFSINGATKLTINSTGVGIGCIPLATFDVAGAIIPHTDNAYNFGLSSYRWSAIWAATATINTSDSRQKTSVTPSDLGLSFIKSLNPVSYKWINGGNTVTQEIVTPAVLDTEGNITIPAVTEEVITPNAGIRTHYGMLAQEVATALTTNGVIKDFGGYIYDKETDSYGLRYEEFISPLIKAIQELSAEVATLNAKVGT